VKFFIAIFATVFLLPSALPQRPMPKDNRYEVVSIKSGSVPGVYNSFQGSQTTFNSSLKSLMATAFGVYEQDLIGLPKWAEAEHFTIIAKAKSPIRDNLDRYTMLQSVFRDRFALKYHAEKRTIPVYLVTAAPGGIRLPVTAPASCVAPDPAGGPPPPPSRPRGPVSGEPGSAACGLQGIGVGPDGLRLQGKGAPMSYVLVQAEHYFDRRLVDKTGSDKKYDVDISFLRNSLPSAAEIAEPSSGLPTITAALKKVGILVAPGNYPVDVIVIDHVERPSAN
jgi:uncharacterized protein (TIGR03435 family)